MKLMKGFGTSSWIFNFRAVGFSVVNMFCFKAVSNEGGSWPKCPNPAFVGTSFTLASFSQCGRRYYLSAICKVEGAHPHPGFASLSSSRICFTPVLRPVSLPP